MPIPRLPGFPKTGVAYPGSGTSLPSPYPLRYLPPNSQDSKPPEPPPDIQYPYILHHYYVYSFMGAVPLVFTEKARLLVDLTKEEDLALFMHHLQVFLYEGFEVPPISHFITHIVRSEDTYWIYRRNFVNLEHFHLSDPLPEPRIFETLGIYRDSEEFMTVYRRYSDGWLDRTTIAPLLLRLFKIEDGGSVLIYAPFTNIDFRAEYYFQRDSAGYITSEFSPSTPFTWAQSAYAQYLSYLIDKGYPVFADVFPFRVGYVYYVEDGPTVRVDEGENASTQKDRWYYPPVRYNTLFSGRVDKYYDNYTVGTTYSYEGIPYSRLYYYDYYKQFFPAEAIRRYTLNAGHISLDRPQAKLVSVVSSTVIAPLRSVIERNPFSPVSEYISSTARFPLSSDIQRKPLFILQEKIDAKAQTSLHINILPFFRLIHQIQRQPQFQLTEFIVPLYTPAYFRLKLEIVGGAKTSINQNINRKFFIPVISRVSSKCYFQINENLSRLPFFTLIQKHISHPRLRLITRLKAPPPRFCIDITLYSQCRHPLRIRCWRYERPIRNFDYYRYYGITIRS